MSESEKTAKPSRGRLYTGLVIGLWALFLSFAVLFPLYVYTVSIDFMGLYGGLPSLKAFRES